MKMNRNLRIGAVIFAVLCVVAFIFSNSLQDGEESTEKSDVFVELFRPILDPTGVQEDDDLSYAVRKLAHLTEFACLGALVCLFWRSRRSAVPAPLRGIALRSILTCLPVAAGDELIQCFFERSPSFADVLLDLTGSAFGIVLVLAAGLVREKN
ncbi:MAG: VanZ family protein [Clostridia bacterium]|nr:VanZ family protein [Clostridia bacterium]